MPLALALATTAAVQTISFPAEDGGRVCADLYGQGARAVVLAHGVDNDVIAAVRYLKEHGAKSVSVVGGSFGGAAAGDASIKSLPGEIDRIVFLGGAPNLSADKLKSRSLFIVAREDRSGSGARLPGIRAQYEMAPEPKELIVLDGSAHAQFLFQTDQNTRVMHEIVRFLSAP